MIAGFLSNGGLASTMRIRKDDNIFRKYLAGRLGGTPRVSPGEFVREAAEALR